MPEAQSQMLGAVLKKPKYILHNDWFDQTNGTKNFKCVESTHEKKISKTLPPPWLERIEFHELTEDVDYSEQRATARNKSVTGTTTQNESVKSDWQLT